MEADTAPVDEGRRPQSREPSWKAWLAASISGALVALVSVALFGVSGRDDPYITFSAAEAIRDSGSLVNINGDPIEQSTTLLFTLLLALASAVVPVPVPTLGWLLGLSSLAGVVVVSFAILRSYLTQGQAVLGAIIVGLTPPLLYWSTSGAEQSLGVLLVIGSILAITRRSRSLRAGGDVLLASGLTVLTFLCRPDLGLAIVAGSFLLLGGRLITGRRTDARFLSAILTGQVVGLLVLTLARLQVTGSPLPQPLNAKVGGNVIEQGLRGMDYFVSNATSWWFLGSILIGAWAAWTGRRQQWRPTQVLLLLVAVVLLAGMVVSGGDWMELGRFFATPGALLLLLAISLLDTVSQRAFATSATILIALEVITLIAWSVAPAAFDSRGSSVIGRWTLATTGSPGVPEGLDTPFNRWNADHLGDAYFLGAAIPIIEQVLNENPGRELTITSGQGGMIPYHLQDEFGDRIRFIDRFQLMTDDFASCELAPGPYGAFISWNQWKEFAGDCAPELPDMAFSIGPIPVDDLGDDYEVVVHVEGTADRNGDSLPQEQWLAVRRDLLHAVSS